MDFARKQLEKYGWSEGKGLGKAENGIRHAIKPKPKHGQGGIGHDIAEEFTNHWWQNVYNNAADNIEVIKAKNGEIENFSTRNKESIDITTKTWVKPKLSKNEKLSTISEPASNYKGKFINRAILTNGLMLTDNRKSDGDDSDSRESTSLCKIEKLTDQDLFLACGGRTAHKGARHGIKSNGKLSRINKHEDEFLEKMTANSISTEKTSSLRSTPRNCCDEKNNKIAIAEKTCFSNTAKDDNSQQLSAFIDSKIKFDGIQHNCRRRKYRCNVIDSDSKSVAHKPHTPNESGRYDQFRKKMKKCHNQK